MPFVFLSNGEEVRFLDRETDAHARRIAGFWSQDDLERRVASRRLRRDLSGVATVDSVECPFSMASIGKHISFGCWSMRRSMAFR